MPNWTYNYLDIEGSADNIVALKNQLNKPFKVQHDSWDMESNEMKKKWVEYSNPVFAFWNIIAPTNLEAYGEQPDNSLPIDKAMLHEGDSWYDFNYREWGTKWDVGVADGEQYSETEIYNETKNSIGYRFNTAWAPPVPAIHTLSKQYPECTFTLSYEEETGWGGEMTVINGETEEYSKYENKCRDCGAEDCMEYCDNECGEICNVCNWLGEAELEAVAECQTHKVYLKTNVPEYRK